MKRPLFQIALVLIFLTSCQREPSSTSNVHIINGYAMTMEYRIIVGQKLQSSEVATVVAVVQKVFEHVDSTYNNWNPNSEISRFNRAPANEEMQISAELMTLLKITNSLVAETMGYFDPTVGPVSELWKSRRSGSEVPSPEEVEKLSSAVGWDKIVLTENGIAKKHPLTKLDLCAIAKGYCVDLITDAIVSAGYKNVYVEWGGEIRAAGVHPEGRPWTIYISRLEDTDPNHAIDYVELRNEAVATSGDYLQSWEMSDGFAYTHIIDPHTLYPIRKSGTNICSATVRGESCVVADALATAAVAFPNNAEAQAWAVEMQEKIPSLQFWLVTRNEKE